ncbi:Alpha/Beta hydrolase protein [Aspergillus similis]
MAGLFSSWGRLFNSPLDPESAPGFSDTNSGPEKFPSGLKLLADGGSKSIVDIVFVHGLTGDREKTWTAPNSATSWPESLLPAAIPNARILTFGYDAYITDWRNMVSINRVGNHAMNLVTALATWREQSDTNDRTIFFVCHSLGGIVCQDAIATSQQYPEPHIHGLAECIKGIIFLGTPHGGSGLAHWAEMLARSISLIKQANSEIISVLERESEVLARIQSSFHAFIRSKLVDGEEIKMTTFYEELPLPGVGPVVPMQSAIIPGYPSIGIRATHMGMTKFETSNDAGFTAVVGELRRWTRQIEDFMREGAASNQLEYTTHNR